MILPRAASWVVVANRAIARLGVDMISSLSGTKTADLCNLYLEEAVNTVLAARPFRDSIKRAELAALSDAPLFGYDYQFQLPEDFLSIAKDENQVPQISATPYVVEAGPSGKVILTDSSTCEIVYIAMPPTPAYLAPYVITAISLVLAWKLAPSLTSNENLTAILMSEKEKALQEAIEADAKLEYAPSECDKRGFTWPDELR